MNRRAALMTAVLVLALLTGLARAAGTGELVFVSRADGVAGAGGDLDGESPAIDHDGRYIAFYSQSTNLDEDQLDSPGDIFVRDTKASETIFVSRADGPTGTGGNGDSHAADVSDEGNRVVFGSHADNLDGAGAPGAEDVFLRDIFTNDTQLVSRPSGAGVGDAASGNPAISGDGDVVAFESASTNFSVNDEDATVDVFARRISTGNTVLVSRGAMAGPGGNDDSLHPAVSADGRYVVFASDATNIGGGDTVRNIYRRDLQTGDMEHVSVSDTEQIADDDSDFPSISADGRYVVFQSEADNLSTQDDNGELNLFVRDLQMSTTELVSRAASGGPADGGSERAVISGDGRYVTFYSVANNLVDDPAENESVQNVYVRDLQTDQNFLVSRADDDAATGGDGDSQNPDITFDGRFVAFMSNAENLTGEDTAFYDIFRSDWVNNGPVAPPPPQPPGGGEPPSAPAAPPPFFAGSAVPECPVTGTAGADGMDGAGGDDCLSGAGGDDTLGGGTGNDTLAGDAGVDTVSGGPGRDVINGGSERDFLTGDSEDDTIDGGPGSNVVDGGGGSDKITGGEAADSLNGGSDGDTIDGGDGDDGITGASGDDDLNGGDGEDRIEGGLGRDDIDGGADGDNIVSIDGAADTVKCGSGKDVVRADGGDKVASDCENVIERPGSFEKQTGGEDDSADLSAIGSGGSVLTGTGSAFSTLTGGGANDTIDSPLVGDSLLGLGGSDRLDGALGDDRGEGGDATDIVSGGPGNDTLLGGLARDFMEGSVGTDTVDGEAGSNVLNGSEGNDTVRGGEDADSLNGGSDEDTIYGGDGDDGVTGASGDDKLYGEDGDDRIEGGLGKDDISGGAGGDSIVAADGIADKVRCGSGDDTVRADEGDSVASDCELVIERRDDEYVVVRR